MKLLAAAALAALALSACDKTEPAPGTTGTTATGPKTTVSDDAIATEEDFEDEAEQQISAQNVEDELDKLEKEITD